MMFLVKLIYGNKLVRYLHWPQISLPLNLSIHVFQHHQRSLSLSVYLQFQMINCQFDLSGLDFEGRVMLICRDNIQYLIYIIYILTFIIYILISICKDDDFCQ